MDDEQDPRLAWALARYQVISAYLALDPPRGQREPLRRELAGRSWPGPGGEPFTVAAETSRTWVRRYHRRGLKGLMDEPRQVRGVQALDAAQVELLCKLKQEVPERSLDRLIKIAEETGLVERSVLHRSTVHRVLRARGLSRRPNRVPNSQDLDRFEADRPNDLWQSDLLYGPWLPDPDQPGKVRRAYLYAFLDDHSRLLLHGRFSFREHLPMLELAFRRALQKHGVPRRLYYDNGMVYHSGHMQEIAATLGIHRVIFTQPKRPMGHGKIEAFNRLATSSFLAELKATRITTLDALNEAFLAWGDDYNRTVHGETGATPKDRWRAGVAGVRFADDEALRQAFLWKERRTPDKAGVFSLLGIRYQVGPALAKRQVEVRFDPEELHEVEVWLKGAFVQRARPLDVHAHRRPRVAPDAAAAAPPGPPTADWLGHLVARRRQEGHVEPSPRQLVEQARSQRAVADDALLAALRSRLSPEVCDEAEIRSWLAEFGPLDPTTALARLDALLAAGHPTDGHVRVLLAALRPAPGGDR